MEAAALLTKSVRLPINVHLPTEQANERLERATALHAGSDSLSAPSPRRLKARVDVILGREDVGDNGMLRNIYNTG